MPTTPQTERLNLIRYLLEQAKRQVQEPQPVCAIAILAMHDAIEMFLDLVAEITEANLPKNIQFMEYWSCIESAQTKISLPMKNSMKRLNDARIMLKHKGQTVSQEHIKEHIANGESFLKAACEQVFSIEISRLSLVNFIKDPKILEYVQGAIEQLERNIFDGFYSYLATAFDLTLSLIYKRSPNLFRPNLNNLVNTSGLGVRNSDIEKVIKPLLESIRQMRTDILSVSDYSRRGLALVSLGVRLRDYEFFLSKTPKLAFISRDGLPGYQPLEDVSDNIDDAQFCLNFVINFILRVESGKSIA